MTSILDKRIIEAKSLFKNFEDLCQYLPTLKSILEIKNSENEQQLSSLCSHLMNKPPINLNSVVKIINKLTQENSRINRKTVITLSHMPLCDQIASDIKSLRKEIFSLQSQQEELNAKKHKNPVQNKVNQEAMKEANKQKELALKHEANVEKFINRLKCLQNLLTQFQIMHGDQIEAYLKSYLQNSIEKNEKKIQIFKSCIDELFGESVQSEKSAPVAKKDSWTNWSDNKLKKSEKEFEIAIQLLDSDQFKKAITHFENSLKYNPNHLQATFNQGIAHLHLNEYTQALKLFEKAICLNSKLAILFELQGDALSGLGKVTIYNNILIFKFSSVSS